MATPDARVAQATEATKAAAEVIREEARRHKQLAQHHRRESQRLMERLAEIRDNLAACGIDLTSTTEPEGGA